MHFSDDLPGLCQEPRSTSYGMPREQRLAQGAKETGWHSYYYCDPVEYEVKASKHAVRRGAAPRRDPSRLPYASSQYILRRQRLIMQMHMLMMQLCSTPSAKDSASNTSSATLY